MNATKFQNAWNVIRVYTFVGCIIFFIILLVSSFTHPFDADCRAGEIQIIEEEQRNQDNKEAFDRMQNGEEKEGDAHKALDYLLENMATNEIYIKQINPNQYTVVIISKNPSGDERDRD